MRVQGSVFRVKGLGCMVWGSRFRIEGLGLRVQGSGFRAQGSGLRVQGSGFRVQGSGFRVWGSELRLERREGGEEAIALEEEAPEVAQRRGAQRATPRAILHESASVSKRQRARRLRIWP